MARYSPEDRIRALEALRASAEVVDGVLTPRFRAVAKAEGMPHHDTLRKWWRERDREDDATILVTVQRARESEVGKGVEQWLQHQYESCRDVVEYCLDPMHRVGGPEQRIPPHQMARALKDLLPLLKEINGVLNGEGTRTGGRRLYNLRRTAQRVRITEKRKAQEMRRAAKEGQS